MKAFLLGIIALMTLVSCGGDSEEASDSSSWISKDNARELAQRYGTCSSIYGFSVLYLKDMYMQTNDSSLRTLINMDAHDHAIYKILLTEHVQAQPQEKQDVLIQTANRFMNEQLISKDLNGPLLVKMKSEFCPDGTISREEKGRIMSEYQASYEQVVDQIKGGM